MAYKLLFYVYPYIFWGQVCRSLEWKPLNGIQGVKGGLIWYLESLLNTSWIGSERDELFEITAVSYYIVDILYTVVIITAPYPEV